MCKDLVVLLLCILLGSGCDDVSEPVSPRVLVVGWDGATYRMVDPLLERGRLPNLQSLLDRGATAELVSTAVPISSAAWVTATTGKTPGQTGVYSFFEALPNSYDVELISSRNNRATPIWRILARRNLRSIVMGVPVTYPPEPIPGVMVGGMLAPFDSVYAHPAALDRRLKQSGFVPDLGMWQRRLPIISPPKVREQLAIKDRFIAELLEEEAWTLAWIVFKSLDVISHASYDGTLDGPVARHYAALDEVLGRLLGQVGAETNVLLVSDHGFNAYGQRFNPRAWLIREGFARLEDDPVAGKRHRGALARARAREHSELRKSLDMARTRAFSSVAEGNYGTIRLNLAGREPLGSVEPGQADAVLDEIEKRLLGTKQPDGSPLVRQVFRTAEFYPGPYSDLLPDLIFEVDPRVVVHVTPSGPVHQRLSKRKADHDRIGILIAAGPDIVRESERFRLSIADLTPTVLQLLELPIYEEMKGRPACELLASCANLRRVAEADAPPDSAAVEAFSTRQATSTSGSR